MNSIAFQKYDRQLSTLTDELESTWKNVNRALDVLVGSLQEMQRAIDAVNQAELSADESADEVEISLDGYESVLEVLKTGIIAVDTEVDNHIKLCIDVQCTLRELKDKAANALKSPL